MLNGVPHGFGRFDSVDANGLAWYYEGEFQNGVFDGQGIRCWPEDAHTENGTYTNGSYTPTYPKLVKHLGENYDQPFSMSDTTFSFLQEHSALFPASSQEAEETAQSLIQPGIAYPQIEKNISKIEGKLFHISDAYVLQAEEKYMVGLTITYLLVEDSNSDSYLLYYNGELPDIYSGNVVSFTGLPIAKGFFSNASGGTTWAAAVVAPCSVTLLY